MKKIAILGSTGSIGTQTLDVVRKHPDRFKVVALTAGSNEELLAAQTDEFKPLLSVLASRDGERALIDAATHDQADIVVNALVGSMGLVPTMKALESGKVVALANKESLVAGGDLVMRLAKPGQLLPLDSEHSAIFQCLHENRLNDVRRIIITASGGPFRGRSSLEGVTIEQALAHPTWRMGAKITIDSATLMNKGLEAIEAHHLFGAPIDRIEIVVHPQSIVHGIVEFSDSSSIAQASTPDMRLPIQVALAWPERLDGGCEPLSWQTLGSLEFEPLDTTVFKAPALAFEAARKGLTYPAALNAANEEAVAAFLASKLDFTGIVRVVSEVLDRHDPDRSASIEAVLDAEQWARAIARELIA
ncbi:MAG: 1-deoxy-D-xylulose-5-phosphate reductoisomerase [Actinomycetota bacterium]